MAHDINFVDDVLNKFNKHKANAHQVTTLS
jgi:hypothetical protein